MEVREVIGDSTPQKFEKLQGGTLLNTDVQEVLIEDVTKYKYKQVFVTEINEEKLEKLFNIFTIKIHKDYLEDTKWYIDRLNDPSSGKAVPEEVLTKRAFAREEINTLEAELITLQGAI
jgi:Glu-tRNA(Gln) amidotransferase subunit E-like FAD-binding protein